jgi:low affinity Fe/Cu permease
MGDAPDPHATEAGRDDGLHHQIGRRVSDWVANAAAHPFVQLGFVIFCIAWLALDLPTNLLTAILSILAITLTQMVLNRQYQREIEDRRRDAAMHAKIDELVAASREEREEIARMEEAARCRIGEPREPHG